MPNIAIIDIQSSQIQNIYTAPQPQQSMFGGPWSYPSVTVHIQIPDDLDKDIVRARKDESGAFILEVDPEKQAAKVDGQWRALRQERNRRLADCDWTRLDDNTLTEEQKTKWAAYRQALRDFPNTVTDPNPDGLVWPTLDTPMPVAPVEPVLETIVEDPTVAPTEVPVTTTEEPVTITEDPVAPTEDPVIT